MSTPTTFTNPNIRRRPAHPETLLLFTIIQNSHVDWKAVSADLLLESGDFAEGYYEGVRKLIVRGTLGSVMSTTVVGKEVGKRIPEKLSEDDIAALPDDDLETFIQTSSQHLLLAQEEREICTEKAKMEISVKQEEQRIKDEREKNVKEIQRLQQANMGMLAREATVRRNTSDLRGKAEEVVGERKTMREVKDEGKDVKVKQKL